MIAGGGFAVMAWGLAQHHTYGCERASFAGVTPVHRDNANHAYPCSAEYYRILDRAWDDTMWAMRFAPGHCMTVRL